MKKNACSKGKSSTNRVGLCAKVGISAALIGFKHAEAVTNAISDERFPTSYVFV